MDNMTDVIAEVEIIQNNDLFSWEEIANLLHDAFQERLKQGLQFTCSFLTAKELEQKSNNCIVLIAKNKISNQLLGTVFYERKSSQRAYHSNLAVNPTSKHLGIATKLFSAFKELASINGCEHIISDTAQQATSSVLWHKKNGFIPISLRSYGSTNYYSIVFRNQLKHHWFWSNKLFCKIHFTISSILCHMYRHKDGTLTTLGKLIEIFRISE